MIIRIFTVPQLKRQCNSKMNLQQCFAHAFSEGAAGESLEQYMQPTFPNTTYSNQKSKGGGGIQLPIDICTLEQRKQRDEIQKKLVEQRLLKKLKSRFGSPENRKPIAYERPSYNTPQYWRDCAQGWITDEQQRQDHADFEARRKRALDSKHNTATSPHRHQRPVPRETKQFSKSMSTQAARDDRLTPQSKALLQVLVARTGKGRFTDTTKTTLGIIMNRCPRSVQRYVQELIKFGYIRTQVRKSRRTGFFIGLRVWIMNSVLPFYAQENEEYNPEMWVDLISGRRNPEETEESLTKVKDRILNAFKAEKPPWFAEYMY